MNKENKRKAPLPQQPNDLIIADDITEPHLLANRLTFNGGTLAWVGNNPKGFSGFSGKADESAKESTANEGPIPQGKYAVDPANIEEFSESDDWGSHRVRCEPYRATVDRMRNCFGIVRTGFYIHGGNVKGTAGCVELNDNTVETEFFNKLKSHGQKIELEIKYTGSGEIKYEENSCPYP